MNNQKRNLAHYINAFVDQFNTIENILVNETGLIDKKVYISFMEAVKEILEILVFQVYTDEADLEAEEAKRNISMVSSHNTFTRRILAYKKFGKDYHERLASLIKVLTDFNLSRVAKIFERQYFICLKLYPETQIERLEVIKRIKGMGGDVDELIEKVKSDPDFLLELPIIVRESKKYGINLSELFS